MRMKIREWIKEILIGISFVAMMMAVLFGGNVIRGTCSDHGRSVSTVSACIGSSNKTSDVIIRESVVVKMEEPAGLEAVAAESVQSVDPVSETEIVVPDYIVRITEKVGQTYSISPEFLQAIAWRESRFDPTAVNKAGTCFGLMQVSVKWHGHRLEKGEDILDPEVNIRIAAEYLSELFEQYVDPDLVLMVYNGDRNALKSGYQSGYVKDILELAEQLEGGK